MLVIQVKVNGVEIEASQPTISSGTCGHVKMCFAFDSAWRALAKTAVFKLPRGNVLVPLDKDACTVPAEVLEKSGRVKFGVFGTDGEKTLTSLYCSLNVDHGVYTVGESAANYTPSLYELFVAKFQKFENMGVLAVSGQEAAAFLSEENGKMVLNLTLPRGEKGDNGNNGNNGNDYVLTDDDKDEIAKIATLGIENALDEIIAIEDKLIGEVI